MINTDECNISVRDRSYLLGDGLFETILVSSGQPVFLSEHLDRIASSALFLGYSLPERSVLADAVGQVVEANNSTSGSLRLTVSPAESTGLLATDNSPINICITFRRGTPYAAELYNHGLKAVIAKNTRRNEHSPLSRHKTTCFLDSVLAKKEAVAAGADEALLLNTSGNLAEGSVSNLFLVYGSKIVTPPLLDGALPGIVRNKFISLCGKLEISLHEETVHPEALKEATEAFLTNSLLGVMPLVSIEALPVGDGLPGIITQGLRKAYETIIISSTCG